MASPQKHSIKKYLGIGVRNKIIMITSLLCETFIISEPTLIPHYSNCFGYTSSITPEDETSPQAYFKTIFYYYENIAS